MGTTADNSLATTNNQPQNRDGDGVGDKLEGGSAETWLGTTQQQQLSQLAQRMWIMAFDMACADDGSCTDGDNCR